MSDNRSWSDIGEELRDAVGDALRSGNFKDLSDVVMNTVTDTVRNVSSRVGQAVSESVNYTEEYEQATRQRQREREKERQAAKEARLAMLPAPFRRVGRVSSVLYRVFGGIGTGVMAVLCTVFGGLGLGYGGGWWTAFSVLALLLGAFVLMVNVGCKQKLRLKRAEKYVELSGQNQYVNVEELALHTNRTPRFVLKDIRRMLELGFFPQGHLDSKGSCLMLNDRIYREYITLEKQRKVLEKEQKAQARRAVEEKPQPAKQPQESAGGSELDEMITQGQDCIRRLRNMNDNIPGEEISAKLFRLENLLKEIPEQLPQMQKFMNYYLPTTLKLVGAYEQFDDLSAQGDEIREAKAEIEKTLDTINCAFEELLNRMFRETAFDVTTDAQVLQTMLAKEGLTGQRDFEFEKVSR